MPRSFSPTGNPPEQNKVFDIGYVPDKRIVATNAQVIKFFTMETMLSLPYNLRF